MKKGTVITAIDVGTTKVCTIIAEAVDGNTLRVAGVGITPSSGMHKGLVVSIEEAKESIRESVRRAEHASRHKVESAYIGVTGRHIASLNRRGAISINRSDRLVRLEDLRKVLQSARSFRIPDGRKLLHVIPRGYAVDGSTGVTNPVGMHGHKLDVETHVITAAAASIRNIAKCIQGLGIGIDELVLEPLASSEAVLSEEEKQKGVVLADIGGGTTDVAVFKDGSIWHTAIIPVAGYQLTRDIAIGLGLSFNAAEEAKRNFGTVLSLQEGRAGVSGRIADDERAVSRQELTRILRARMEEILRLILLELPQTRYEALVPAGLVLTGGSSNLAGLDMMGHQILRLPVKIGMPVRMKGLGDELCDPAYATGVGLLLWGAKHQDAPEAKFHSFNDNLQRLISDLRKIRTRSLSFLLNRMPMWNR
ncbi:MAG: cell division protein FtsA [Chloroflexi bacterium]|nr:cell division protein FtsA [Chloroflexota bacterium]